MKKSAYYLLVPFLLVIGSCDKVERPVVIKDIVVGTNFVTNDNALRSDFRKIFIEDYTGQRCKNCPYAAEVIEQTLMPRYGDTLVAVAVHQGNTFASPAGTYTNDFRTTTGETWGASFGIDAWPNGMINRKKYNRPTPKQAVGTWINVAKMAVAESFVLKLDVKTEYDTAVKGLNTYIKGTFLSDYPNPVKLIAVYTEDKIIGLQDDGGVEVHDYEFNHMLRGSLNNDPWGDFFTSKASLKGDTVSLSLLNIGIPERAYDLSNKPEGYPINDKNISVVIFAHDATTKEILQAERVKIRPVAGDPH